MYYLMIIKRSGKIGLVNKLTIYKSLIEPMWAGRIEF